LLLSIAHAQPATPTPAPEPPADPAAPATDHTLDNAQPWDPDAARATDRLSSRDASDAQGRPYDAYQLTVTPDRPHLAWLLPTRFAATLRAYGNDRVPLQRGAAHLVWAATGPQAHVVVSTTTPRDLGQYTLYIQPVPLLLPGDRVRGELSDADPRLEAVGQTFDLYAVQCVEGQRVRARVTSDQIDVKVWAAGFAGLRVNDETGMFDLNETNAIAADSGYLLLFVSTIDEYNAGPYTLELLTD
jgi:hypothetical protein